MDVSGSRWFDPFNSLPKWDPRFFLDLHCKVFNCDDQLLGKRVDPWKSMVGSMNWPLNDTLRWPNIGKWSNLRFIFFRWVGEPTTNQLNMFWCKISSRPKTRPGFPPQKVAVWKRNGTLKISEKSRLVKYYSIWPHGWKYEFTLKHRNLQWPQMFQVLVIAGIGSI